MFRWCADHLRPPSKPEATPETDALHSCERSARPQARYCSGRRPAVTAHRRSPAKQETRARTGVVEFGPKGQPRWRDSYRRRPVTPAGRAASRRPLTTPTRPSSRPIVSGSSPARDGRVRVDVVAGFPQPSAFSLSSLTFPIRETVHAPGRGVASDSAGRMLRGGGGYLAALQMRDLAMKQEPCGSTTRVVKLKRRSDASTGVDASSRDCERASWDCCVSFERP